MQLNQSALCSPVSRRVKWLSSINCRFLKESGAENAFISASKGKSADERPFPGQREEDLRSLRNEMENKL